MLIIGFEKRRNIAMKSAAATSKLLVVMPCAGRAGKCHRSRERRRALKPEPKIRCLSDSKFAGAAPERAGASIALLKPESEFRLHCQSCREGGSPRSLQCSVEASFLPKLFSWRVFDVAIVHGLSTERGSPPPQGEGFFQPDRRARVGRRAEMDCPETPSGSATHLDVDGAFWKGCWPHRAPGMPRVSLRGNFATRRIV